MLEVQVLGSEYLKKTLQGLPPKLQKTILENGMVKSCEQLKATASTLARKLTGRMAFTMTVKTFSRKGVAGARVTVGTRSELGISPKNPYFYPMAQEFGTSELPAHPFLRPALSINRMSIIMNVASDIQSEIGKV